MAKINKVDKSKNTTTNKSNVMKCIILNGPINRAAIAKRTFLSIPSVMTITDDLIARDLVQAVGKGKSSGGKRPELLSVIAESEYYVGVDIGRGTVRLVIVDLSQKVVFGTREATGEIQPPEAFVNRLCSFVLRCIQESGIDTGKIAGIGIAMPGLIEQETGHVIFSPDFAWSDVPLQEWAQSKLPYPVIVENANRALALAESQYEINTEKTVLCVNMGHGIGAAMVQAGTLYYGSSGTSGEIGHITVNKDGTLCACGNSGCLEAMASGDAIAQQARDAIQSGIPTILTDMQKKSGAAVDAKAVFDAAAKEDHVALSIVEKAADYIGIGLAMAINILDPDQIVLCGGLTKNGPAFIERITDSMQRRRMRQAGRHVSIEVGQKGDYATAIGAAKIIPYNGWRVPKLQHYYY